jgi:protein-disulfide isomerase
MDTAPQSPQPTGPSPVLEKLAMPLALFLGLAVIAGAIAFGKGAASDKGQDGAPSAVDAKKIDDSQSPIVGEKNAPVTMVVWYDYQCPFCKKLELEAMPQVYENYVKEGKVRIVLKDFQFLGEYSDIPGRDDSTTAALFGRAVWDAYPDRFYDWYVAMAERQDEENGGFGDLASIQTMTRELGGIDVDRVTRLLSEKQAEYLAAIEADRTEGASLGVNGTPAIVIGTTLLAGAQPYARLSALIDAELAKK